MFNFNNKKKYESPSDKEVTEKKKEGQKFIPVTKNYVNNDPNYVKTELDYEGSKAYFLIPTHVMKYVVDSGEGAPDKAIDELSGLYRDLREFEKDLIKDSKTCIHESILATKVRSAYETYLINKLTKDGKNFDVKTLDDLGVNNKTIDDSLRTIAAIALGKTSINDLTSSGLGDMLVHVNKINWRPASQAEKETVACYAGSHYELREQYRNTAKAEGNNVYVREDKKEAVFNLSIKDCFNKISNEKQLSKHDENLLREYVNLKYLLDKGKKLPINPEGE